MTIYTLRSFASSGKIVAVQQFSAETDAEALSMARDMVHGAGRLRGSISGKQSAAGAARTMKEEPRR